MYIIILYINKFRKYPSAITHLNPNQIKQLFIKHFQTIVGNNESDANQKLNDGWPESHGICPRLFGTVGTCLHGEARTTT